MKMSVNFKQQLISLMSLVILVNIVNSKELHMKEQKDISANSEDVTDDRQYYNEYLRHHRYVRHLDSATETAMGHMFGKMGPSELSNFFKRVANTITARRRSEIKKKKRLMEKKIAKEKKEKLRKKMNKKSKKWFEDAANKAPKKNVRKNRNNLIKLSQKQEEKDEMMNNSNKTE